MKFAKGAVVGQQVTPLVVTVEQEDRRMNGCSLRRVVVIKLGGSVLADDESYRRAARYLVRRLHKCSEDRFVVVVSARKGLTDELERLARGITGYPNPRTIDLLWSTGELHSVALLTLHLEELGVTAVGLNVQETGLRFNGASGGEARIESLSGEIQRAFDDHSVVVVPGFFGTLAGGMIVSLGRGGSDLSAVLLSREFESKRCELIKDVPGYFTEDPDITSRAEHLPWVSYDTALEMAARGCELVQRVALEAARESSLELVVRGLADTVPGTVVSAATYEDRASVTET
jgi:aspartate kinase